ncbi:threonine-phosphate decarboxylase CobD [Geminocystis sp. CENA526]|uniref:threonine-phosphate decarboxylase CobD n=1 Tax=Geminocystis sp. CENA526 TaxID=1355871 RepID=UPI003D6F10E6
MTRPTHGGNLDWAVTLINCPNSAVLDFSASINPLGPPQSTIEAIIKGIKQLAHYPNPDYPQFRQAIGQHHHICQDWVLPSNGAAELLTWIAWEAHNLEGVLLPSPCFADYKRALNTFNIPFESYGLDELAMGLKYRGNVALLVNNPHNPTGKLWDKKTLIPYLQQFPLVVIDEAFMDFLPPNEQESLIDLIPDYDNLIVVRSITKFYSLPALRIGYGITHPDRIKKWQKWRDPWTVNSLAQLAGIEALKDTEFQQKTWQWLKPSREKLKDDLAQIKGLKPLPSSANFILVETRIPSPQLQLELLQREQILIRDCLSFPELGEKYFRVAVRTQEDNQRLSNAITQTYQEINSI